MKNVTSVCVLVGALMNEKRLSTSMLLVISVYVLLLDSKLFKEQVLGLVNLALLVVLKCLPRF